MKKRKIVNCIYRRSIVFSFNFSFHQASSAAQTACSQANRSNNLSTCLLQIKTALIDPNAFWFGKNYETECPEGTATPGVQCSNPRPNNVDSVATRIFQSDRPSFLSTYIDVTFTSMPGKYTVHIPFLHIKQPGSEEEEEQEFYDLSALYRLFKSSYSHIYRAYRGKKGETEIGYRDTWNSTTATLVLLRARSTAPIHRSDILRPHPMDNDEYDGYTCIQ